MDKFVNKIDKIRSQIGQVLIRTIIISKFKINNKYIKLSTNKYGKPFFNEHPNFYFNISHSGNYVVYAIDYKPIGIDIEEIKSIAYIDIAKRFFTKDEFNYIIYGADINSRSKFFDIWTLNKVTLSVVV